MVIYKCVRIFDHFCHIFIEAEDGDFLTPEAQLDEHSPKATRTLFLGNLDKEITIEELKEKLEKYGEILVSITYSLVFLWFVRK